MTNNEFNELLQRHFDEKNTLGLGELLLFDKGIKDFIENETSINLILKRVVNVCGSYQTSARDFVKLISYEDFKRIPKVSPIAALGLRLYLKYQLGVNWFSPDKKMTGFYYD